MRGEGRESILAIAIGWILKDTTFYKGYLIVQKSFYLIKY